MKYQYIFNIVYSAFLMFVVWSLSRKSKLTVHYSRCVMYVQLFNGSVFNIIFLYWLIFSLSYVGIVELARDCSVYMYNLRIKANL